MKYRIGDRLQRITTGVVYEITSYNISFLGYNTIEIETGKLKLWYFKYPSTWKYLGNFSKRDNFEELYNLFNT